MLQSEDEIRQRLTEFGKHVREAPAAMQMQTQAALTGEGDDMDEQEEAPPGLALLHRHGNGCSVRFPARGMLS